MSTEPTWAIELVHFAKQSFTVGTVRDGADGLWVLAFDEAIPYDARVAAALYASVAEADLEECQVIVTNLKRLVLSKEASLPGVNALGTCLLLLQIVLRQFEKFEYEDALEQLTLAESALDMASGWPGFTVSEGVCWDSQLVLDDVRSTLQTNSLEARSRLEGFDGTSWVSVVKGRSTWPRYRNRSTAASRDRKYVESHFESTIGINRLGRTFHSIDPIFSPAVSSLLIAELSGDINEVMRSREALAQHLILRAQESGCRENEVHNVGESLRLLRNSRSDKSLKRTLEWIYLRGPEEALVLDARKILRRSGYPGDCSALDLEVLASASLFMSAADIEKSVSGILNYLASPNCTEGKAFVDERTAWRALNTLMPESSRTNEIALAALERVADPERSYAVIEREILALLEQLEPSSMNAELTEKWRNWGKSQAGSSHGSELVDYARKLFVEPDHNHSMGSLSGMALPLYLILNSNGLVGVVDSEVLAKADDACQRKLEEILAQTEGGTFSFGGYDNADVTLMFAENYQRTELWRPLANFLTNPRVPRELKSKSLSRIAGIDTSRIPIDFKETLRNHWSDVVESEENGVYTEPDPNRPFAEAVVAGVALAISTRDDAIAVATAMAGSSLNDIRQAASDVLFHVAFVYKEWELAQLLLIQLTHDSDATVRAYAAKNLAIVGSAKTGISTQVDSALADALNAHGVRVPLIALHGFQRAAQDGRFREDGTMLMDLITNLATRHPARVIRQAAGIVLDRAEP